MSELNIEKFRRFTEKLYNSDKYNKDGKPIKVLLAAELGNRLISEYGKHSLDDFLGEEKLKDKIKEHTFLKKLVHANSNPLVIAVAKDEDETRIDELLNGTDNQMSVPSSVKTKKKAHDVSLLQKVLDRIPSEHKDKQLPVWLIESLLGEHK